MSTAFITSNSQTEPASMSLSTMSKVSPRGIIHVPRRFSVDEWGGTETVILEISRVQQKSGLKPRILSSKALSSARSEHVGGVPVRRYNYCYPFLGLNAEAVKTMDRKGGNLLSLSLYRALLMEPDVRLYHAHALNRVGGMVRSAAKLRRKPLVVSVHGGVFDVPTAERNSLIKPIEGKFEWGRIFGAVWGSRKVLREADMVILVGESEAIKAREKLDHDRCAYLPNGVDCARFAEGNGAGFRYRHGIPQDAFLIMNIGRIDAQKNQMLLLEAFARMAATARAKAHLVMMGPVTQTAYADKLRAFVAEHGLQDRVHLLPGLRSHDPELVNAYHACDIFALPSMHEPFGIVVLEAWSAGKPVVVSKVGGLKSLVSENETGLFIDPNGEHAADDLAQKLSLLRHAPALRSSLGEAGRLQAQTQYDWSIIAEKTEAIYQRAEAHAAARLRRKAA